MKSLTELIDRYEAGFLNTGTGPRLRRRKAENMKTEVCRHFRVDSIEEIPLFRAFEAFELYVRHIVRDRTEGIKLLEANPFEWFEGTPPEYGKYYVRYISLVGPQFCIAEWLEYDACVPNRNMVKAWIPDGSRSMLGLTQVTHYTRLPEFVMPGHRFIN